MRRLQCLLLLSALLALSSAGAADAPVDVEKAIDKYVAARMRSARIPGLALVVVRGQEIVYAKGHGRADPSGRPVTPQTPFVIGSVTKPFTALAVMQLVEAGKVELDAPVQRYLPWFRVADPGASTRITVRHLLYQTSGIPQGPTLETWNWSDADDAAIERHVRLLADVELSAPPGKTFIYANANYVTLGMLIRAVSGESYEDYVKRHIFAPLAMNNSFLAQDEAMRHGMAMGYRWWFGFPVAANLPFNRSNLPAGFAISSAEDMAHFLIAQLNGGRYKDQTVLSAKGIESMWVEPAPNTYAMGWESTTLNGRQVIDHDGGTANFQASLFFDPEMHVGVFVVANAINALDTFSSPPGSSSVDGPTVRAMAASVLSIATGQPLPPQGPGLRRLTVMFDIVLLTLSVLLLGRLVRMRKRYRRLVQRGLATRTEWLWRTGRAAALHLAWPLLLLLGALYVPSSILVDWFQPDLAYWLKVVAVVVTVKGLVEIALLWNVYGRTRHA